MRVVDHEPYAWFLLEEEGRLYLDAHCSHSFLDYSVIMELNEAEAVSYRMRGREALHQLSTEIHNSAPAALGSLSVYRERNLIFSGSGVPEKMHATIMEWRRGEELPEWQRTPSAL